MAGKKDKVPRLIIRRSQLCELYVNYLNMSFGRKG